MKPFGPAVYRQSARPHEAQKRKIGPGGIRSFAVLTCRRDRPVRVVGIVTSREPEPGPGLPEPASQEQPEQREPASPGRRGPGRGRRSSRCSRCNHCNGHGSDHGNGYGSEHGTGCGSRRHCTGRGSDDRHGNRCCTSSRCSRGDRRPRPYSRRRPGRSRRGRKTSPHPTRQYDSSSIPPNSYRYRKRKLVCRSLAIPTREDLTTTWVQGAVQCGRDHPGNRQSIPV